MAFTPDPDYAETLGAYLGAVSGENARAVGDVAGRRQLGALQGEVVRALVHPVEGVTRTEVADGLSWFTPSGTSPGAAVIYLHGGGMIMGEVDAYDPVIRRYVATAGVPMLAVEYRLAPENPYPAGLEDCYDALVWLSGHAAELGVDPARIAVMGDSAGAGLAAALTLLTRERGGPAISRQILIYPMLDDRTTTADPFIAPWALWSHDDNATGWNALLEGRAGAHDIPATAAPGRCTDFTGLPPAFIEVGTLDIFCLEDIRYAAGLLAAGVEVELHVRPGIVHGFELLGPEAAATRASLADRIRVLQHC